MKALSKVGINPILKNEIKPTIDLFYSMTGFKYGSLTIIGSTGKKEISNDIDVAVDMNEYPFEDTCEALKRFYGEDNCFINKGAKIGSFAVPANTQAGILEKLIQIDLMFVNNIEWAKFIYYSPSPSESRYKGAIRTILLSAVASNHGEMGKDMFVFTDGILVGAVRRCIDFSLGLKRKIEVRRTKKDGTLLKTMKPATLEEFREKFPYARTELVDDVKTIDDPNVVVKTLFGPGTNVADINTAEKIIEIINHWEARDKIYERAAQRLKRGVEKIGPIPPEIEEFIRRE